MAGLSTPYDKPLFTPGPLTTSRTVKQAMLTDLGSRDAAFIDAVREIRTGLLAVGNAPEADYTAIPMQGSGTFGIEAVIGSITPPDGKWLFIINGAYGRRMCRIAEVLGIPYVARAFPEHLRPHLDDVRQALEETPDITHVAVVHCETTTGIVNDIAGIGDLVKARDKVYFVDAMSSFGGVPVDVPGWDIDYLVSSANKCIEGVPGFSFVLARRDHLARTEGWARSLSLDLFAQWRGLEATGQFRFTPPTHAMLAFRQALAELAAEGGVAGRATRYQANHRALIAGMQAMGFQTYLQPEDQGPIITSFRYPSDPNFDFGTFYEGLNARGFVIYPGKLSDADTFRIGTIGRIFPADVEQLLAAIEATLAEMGVGGDRG